VTEHLAWYVSRGTGLVTWGLLVAAMVWGLLLATHALGRRARPWWMLGVHGFLGTLTVVFVGVHVLAIMADSYTSFGVVDVLVPFASSWKPLPVALGVVGLYLLAAIEVTSLLQRYLSRAAWRRVHLLSYGLFVVATLHALTAGTDVRAVLVGGVTLGLGTVVVLLGALAWVARSEPRGSGRTGRVGTVVR
jgi:predicted ferric reductase